MGVYAAVASRPILPEPVQDVSSNGKYERTTKGAAAIKVPSMVEYILFPAERRFRRLCGGGGGDVQRLKRNYRDNETKERAKARRRRKKG